MYINAEYIEINKQAEVLQIKVNQGGLVYKTNAIAEEKPFVNIYIYAPDGMLRAQVLYMGTERICKIGKEFASEGCFKGEVITGKWLVVMMSEKEVINLNVTMEPGEEKLLLKEGNNEKQECPTVKGEEESLQDEQVGYKWYAGDFHTHTRLSDGALSLEEVPIAMAKRNLDFVFLTDHNMLPTHLEEYDGVFKGLEVTLSSGHVNMHGVQDDLLECLSNLRNFGEELSKGELGIEDVIDYRQAMNVSINHPFMKPWHYTNEQMLLEKVNTLEIMCDPTWRTAKDANNIAVKFLHFLNKHGHTIVGIGGSDAHLPIGQGYEWSTEPSEYGDPTTMVYTNRFTMTSILKGIQAGRTYVTRGPRFEIIINNGEYLPGDIVKERTITYEMHSTKLNEIVSVHLMINGKERASKLLVPYGKVCFRTKFDKQYQCMSIEVRNNYNELLAFINPIYNGHKSPQFITWGEAVEAFCKQEGVIL